MTDLMELASRVEAGEGPDRELDAAIGVAVAGYFLGEPRYPGAERRYGYVDKEGCRVEPGNGAADRLIPPYTASLDAAMTLVPEGWAIDKISMWPASPEGASNATEPQSSVSMVGTSLERYGRRMVWGYSGKEGRAEATSSTPARALTAAALRARAHQGTAHVEQ